MAAQTHERRRPLRGERGAVAIETALSLVVVAFVLVAGITFGHAMVVRYQLSNSTSRAVRLCAAANDPTAGCLNNRVREGLGATINSCERLNINPSTFDIDAVRGVRGLEVSVTCAYNAPGGARLLAEYNVERLQLSARATMPLP